MNRYSQVTLFLLSVTLLASCAKAPNSAADMNSPSVAEDNTAVAADERLGTTWGDEINSSVTQVNLTRLSEEPLAQNTVHYADKRYQGKSVEAISLASGQIRYSVRDERNQALPLYRDAEQYYLAGKSGQSYQLHYENSSNQTFEIVASVDGIDVLDGSSASRYNVGYVLYPKSSLTIEGFRKSESAVASFTFGAVKDAYANHNANASINNTGVIGSIVYQLKTDVEKTAASNQGYAPEPDAFPADAK